MRLVKTVINCNIYHIVEFIKLCMVRGWLANRIDIQNQIDVYNKAEEETEFEQFYIIIEGR